MLSVVLGVACAILGSLLYVACRAYFESEDELVAERERRIVADERFSAQLEFNRQSADYIERLDRESERLAATHREHEADFLRQIQSLCERIATLRQSGLNAGGEAQFIPMKHDKPYSDDLTRFLGGLETDEAKNLCIEFIEELRAAGIDDEQIYTKLREGQ